MKFSTAFTLALSLIPLATAHTTVWGVWINGKQQALTQPGSKSKYVRTPPNTDPIKDLNSQDLRCNVGGSKAAPQTLSVSAGDTVTFEWHHLGTKSTDLIVDPSHAGPVMVYIAPTSSNGAGPVWVKLFEDNFSGDKWAVHKLRAAQGLHSIIIPDLKPGEYLLRPELLALHESEALYSQKPKLGIQLYMECVQIKIVSNGSVALPKGISIPGDYKDSSPGIKFDMYQGTKHNRSYKAPGGDVWSGSAGGAFGKTVTGDDIKNPVKSTESQGTENTTASSSNTSTRSIASTRSATSVTATATTSGSPRHCRRNLGKNRISS